VFFLLSAGVPVGVVVARAQRSRTTIAAALESVFENEEVPEPGREFLRSRLFYVSSDATAAWEDGPVASFVDEVRRLHGSQLGSKDIASIGTVETMRGSDGVARLRDGGFLIAGYDPVVADVGGAQETACSHGPSSATSLLQHLRFVQRPCTRRVLLLIAGPSGAGKTTLAQMLISARPERCTLLIRSTDRASRETQAETDSVEYECISPTDFTEHARSGRIVFTGITYGHMYGLSIREKRRLLAWRGVIVTTAYRAAHQIVSAWPAFTLRVVGIVPGRDCPEATSQLRKRILERTPGVNDHDLELRLRNVSSDLDTMRGSSELLIRNAENADILPAFRTLMTFVDRIEDTSCQAPLC
jgi:guanylate kinase